MRCEHGWGRGKSQYLVLQQLGVLCCQTLSSRRETALPPRKQCCFSSLQTSESQVYGVGPSRIFLQITVTTALPHMLSCCADRVHVHHRHLVRVAAGIFATAPSKRAAPLQTDACPLDVVRCASPARFTHALACVTTAAELLHDWTLSANSHCSIARMSHASSTFCDSSTTSGTASVSLRAWQNDRHYFEHDEK